MTKAEREAIVAAQLKTPKGKRAFRSAFELAAARAADRFPPGSAGEALGRMLAGLPLSEKAIPLSGVVTQGVSFHRLSGQARALVGDRRR